jgi:hypothetical protein
MISNSISMGTWLEICWARMRRWPGMGSAGSSGLPSSLDVEAWSSSTVSVGTKVRPTGVCQIAESAVSSTFADPGASKTT